MFSLIKKVQQKPEHERRRFAFWLTIIPTTIVVIVWLVSLPSRFGSVPDQESEETVQPFANLRETFSGATNDLKEQLNEQKEEFSETFTDLTIELEQQASTTNATTTDVTSTTPAVTTTSIE